jgi:hypothetical protein
VRPRARANACEVVRRKWRYGLVRRFEQPLFQFGRYVQWSLLLITNGTDDVIDEFPRCITNTGADLALQEIFNVSIQRDVHGKSLSNTGHTSKLAFLLGGRRGTSQFPGREKNRSWKKVNARW